MFMMMTMIICSHLDIIIKLFSPAGKRSCSYLRADFVVFRQTEENPLTLSLQLPIYPEVPTCVRRLKHPRALAGFGRRSFSIAGPDAWNSLPPVIRCIVVPSIFERRL